MKMKYDITFHPSWWHKNAGIEFTQDFFDEPKYRMEADVKMRRCLYDHFGDYGLGEKKPLPRPLLGSDLLAAGYLQSEIMGCEIRYAPNDSPQVICRDFDEDNIADVSLPELDSNLVWQKTLKQIEWLQDNYGRVECYVNLMGVQNIALDLMGQNLFTGYYIEPESIDELLAKITATLMQTGQVFRRLSPDISGGVTAIVRQTVPGCYLTSNCSVEMISNELYEQFLLRYDLKLAAAFGSFGIHHCGATMEHVLAGYSQVPVDFLEAGAGSDVAKVRATFPNVHINARFSPVALQTSSAVEIEQEVCRLYEAVGAAESCPASISCVGIDSKTSDESIREFLRVCAGLS
jgi:hypothetical protein